MVLSVFISVCLGSCASGYTGLSLTRTEFKGTWNIVSGTMASALDLSFVDLRLRESVIHDVLSTGAIMSSSHSHVLVEHTDFRDIQAAGVLEHTCKDVSTALRVQHDEPTLVATNYHITPGETNSLTCKNCVFEDITNDCRTGDNEKRGGAIWAERCALLDITYSVFRRCSTASGSVSYLGGAIMCGASNFVFDHCLVEDCENVQSIVYYAKGGGNGEDVESFEMTGTDFKNTRITTPQGGGGSGLLIQKLKKLVLTNCNFEGNTKSWNENSESDGGCMLVNSTAGSNNFQLELDGCTFQSTKARRGGCFAFIGISVTKISVTNCKFIETIAENKNGGVFFTAQTPSEIAITGTLFKGASAANGAIWYRYETADNADSINIQTLTVQDTTIDGCSVTTNDGFLLYTTSVTREFVFDNNTLMNLNTKTYHLSLQGISAETITLRDWTFENVQVNGFPLKFSDTQSKITMDHCTFITVTASSALNLRANSAYFAELQLIDCEVAGYSSDSGKILHGEASIILVVERCLFTGTLASVIIGDEGATLTLRDSSFEDVTGTTKVLTKSTGLLTLDNVTIRDSTCALGTISTTSPIQIEMLRISNQKTSDPAPDALVELTVSASEGETSSSISNCEFRTVSSKAFKLASGSFKFTDCCFQGSSTQYIEVQGAATLSFELPMCFDKTEDESLVLPDGFTKPWDGQQWMIFECDVCGVIPTTEIATSEPADSASDSEPDASSEQDGEGEVDTTSNPGTGGGGDQDSGNGLPPGATAGIVVAVVVVVVVAVVLIVLFLVRRKKKTNSDDDDIEMFDDDSVTDQETTVSTFAETTQEDAARTNPLFSVPDDGEDFSSVFEETK